ncbi:MAG: phosphoribosylanthranilate isomerase [Gemmatimonadota bacterium]|nr:phosphoribosylanthranilate isomerase [Gemmatimonadota bacterium]
MDRIAGAAALEVKICGVTRPADAALVGGAGADYMGVILSPGFPRSLSLDAAEEVVQATGAKRVGVMVDPEPGWAVEAALRLGLDVVQLHGDESVEDTRIIGAAGAWAVWKVFRVARLDDLRTLGDFAGAVEGVHVDARHRGGKRGGGTGRTFDWAGVGHEVRRRAPTARFIAAGGLTPENVCSAARVLGPDVVDVSSGVEASVGRKDPGRVEAFIRAVAQCTAAPGGSR